MLLYVAPDLPELYYQTGNAGERPSEAYRPVRQDRILQDDIEFTS